jgi:RNA polymerase sigma-70 factor (ECF subfamily)
LPAGEGALDTHETTAGAAAGRPNAGSGPEVADGAGWRSAEAAEAAAIAALRRGDERAFVDLVDALGPGLRRVALLYTPSAAIADEVVQETWIGVIRGLDRFEGRSSLRTWIFRILVNIARTRGEREHRSIPFSAFVDAQAEPGEPAVEPDRFLPADSDWPGHWASFPRHWDEVPEERLASAETLAVVRAAIDTLPPSQREVITLRDVEGWSSDEVCNALEISATNQRVLLHRARSKVRRALEEYLANESQ